MQTAFHEQRTVKALRTAEEDQAQLMQGSVHAVKYNVQTYHDGSSKCQVICRLQPTILAYEWLTPTERYNLRLQHPMRDHDQPM